MCGLSLKLHDSYVYLVASKSKMSPISGKKIIKKSTVGLPIFFTKSISTPFTNHFNGALFTYHLATAITLALQGINKNSSRDPWEMWIMNPFITISDI